MMKLWQIRTKVKINNKIGAGFTFNVPSGVTTGHPSSNEIKAALESLGGKDAGANCAWSDSKFAVLS